MTTQELELAIQLSTRIDNLKELKKTFFEAFNVSNPKPRITGGVSPYNGMEFPIYNIATSTKLISDMEQDYDNEIASLEAQLAAL